MQWKELQWKKWLVRTCKGVACGLVCGLPAAVLLYPSEKASLITLIGLILSGIVAAQFWPDRDPRSRVKQVVDQDIVDAGDTHQLVITVHGTFAAHPRHRGTAWWQQGSRFAQSFDESSRFYLATPHHWSGENSEVARRRASRELCRRILELERLSVPYHLIGHSHGGSVIWLALKKAKREAHLNCLRSWTTVGSPFFQLEWREMELDLLLPLGLGSFLLRGVGSYRGTTFLWRKTLQMMPVLDAFHGQGALAVLGMLLVGVSWVTVSMLCLRVTLQFAGLCLSAWQRRSEARVYRDLETRHLAIWSNRDEALSGLAGAVVVKKSGVGLFPSLSLPGASLFGKLLSPLLLPLVAGCNYLTALFNFVVRRRMIDALHGNPYWFSHVRTVTPYPVGSDRGPGMSVSEEAEVMAEAARNAVATLSAARDALSALATGSKFAVFQERVKEDVRLDGLVHNSYFSCAGVINRIGKHLDAFSKPVYAKASPMAASGDTKRLDWRQPIEPGRTIAYCVVIAGLYAGSISFYRSAVEPITIRARIAAMVKEGDQLATALSRENGRTWYAVLCKAGMCDHTMSILRDQLHYDDLRRLKVMGDPELAGVLEGIRWASFCQKNSCAPRDYLLQQLLVYLDTPGFEVLSETDVKEARDSGSFWFLTPLQRLYAVAVMLGGLHAGAAGTFTPIPEEVLTRQLMAKEANANPKLRGTIRYLLPFFDLQLTSERMAEWDKDMAPSNRLDSKLRMAEGMVCRPDQLHLGVVLPLERISARWETNAFWWGECEQHLSLARAALLAAENDWRDERTPARTARFAAITELVALETGDPQLDQLLLRIDAECDRTLNVALRKGDLEGAIHLLQLRLAFDLDSGRGGDERFMYRAQERMLPLIDWKAAPLPELAALAANRRGAVRLVDGIVKHTAQMEATLSTWDEPMYRLFQRKRGLMSIGTFAAVIFDECDSGKREHCKKWIALADSAHLADTASDLYAVKVDPAYRKYLEQLEQNTVADLSLTGNTDSKIRSWVMADLATAAAADNCFHQALEYAHRADQPSERLRSFSEILASWDRLTRNQADVGDLIDTRLCSPLEGAHP